MKHEGVGGAYVGGREGVPLPTFDKPRTTTAPPSPKPRGLDWSKHRAPDAAPDDELEAKRKRHTRCAVCGRPIEQPRRRSGMCDACQADGELRFGDSADHARLDQELDRLEQRDPVVREARRRLDDVVQRITRPDDHVKAPSEPPEAAGEPCSVCGPGYRVGDDGCRHGGDHGLRVTLSQILHRHVLQHDMPSVCPGCGGWVGNVALVELVYAFTTCTCGVTSFAHLVEQTWHRSCFTSPPGPAALPSNRVIDQNGNHVTPHADETPPSAAEIRAWARANGFTVPDRGRMSQTVHDAYERAHEC